jgi:hypothetical protein
MSDLDQLMAHVKALLRLAELPQVGAFADEERDRRYSGLLCRTCHLPNRGGRVVIETRALGDDKAADRLGRAASVLELVGFRVLRPETPGEPLVVLGHTDPYDARIEPDPAP